MAISVDDMIGHTHSRDRPFWGSILTIHHTNLPLRNRTTFYRSSYRGWHQNWHIIICRFCPNLLFHFTTRLISVKHDQIYFVVWVTGSAPTHFHYNFHSLHKWARTHVLNIYGSNPCEEHALYLEFSSSFSLWENAIFKECKNSS